MNFIEIFTSEIDKILDLGEYSTLLKHAYIIECMVMANWQYLTVGVSAPSNPLVYSSAAD